MKNCKLKINSKHRIKAFSLTELLIALAIVGILVLIALPNLMPLISEAKSTEAKLQLKHLYSLQDRYFKIYSKYSQDLTEIGFEQVSLITDNGKANYRIEIVAAGVDSFKATATSVVDFDRDGQFNVWEVDQDLNLKEVVKD